MDVALHPSFKRVILHLRTNDILMRQSAQLHHEFETLATTNDGLGKIYVISGPILTWR